MRPPTRLLFWTTVCLVLTGGVAVAQGLTPSDSLRPSPRAAPLRPRATPAQTFTFVAGGDIALTGSPDAGIFAGISRFLQSADLAVGNLEGTLTNRGTPKCVGGSGCFTFRASPAWAQTFRDAGFTLMTVANNHALDYGIDGQQDTVAALRRARIAYSGLPGQIRYVRVERVRVAVIGCAPYSWAQSLLDIPAGVALVRKAARHADVVLVYMHAGAEGYGAEHIVGNETYLGEPRGNARAYAHAMIAAGADLVFASGPHLLRGIEWFKRRVIAYSLGNLAGTHTLSTQGRLGLSALLRLTLDDRGGFVTGSVVPLRLAGAGTPVVDAAGASVEQIRKLSQEDFGSRAMRIARTGRLAPPR